MIQLSELQRQYEVSVDMLDSHACLMVDHLRCLLKVPLGHLESPLAWGFWLVFSRWSPDAPFATRILLFLSCWIRFCI